MALRLPSPVTAASAALLALGLSGAASPAAAQTCLEQIVAVQQALKAETPAAKKPPSEPESTSADLSHQPTPGSLAAAGVTQPDSGAMGALNQAMNLQAAGDEQGCLKALAEAKRLGGIN